MITIKKNQTEVQDIISYLSDDQHSLHYISSTMHGYDSEVTAKESVPKILKIPELHHYLLLDRTEFFHKVDSSSICLEF